MRLVKCKKCGATVLTDTLAMENLYEQLKECNDNAKKVKNKSLRNVYLQEASQIKKMITQIQHRTAQMESRKTQQICEMAEIVHYIRYNNLVSDEKLNELRSIARSKAEIRNTEDEKAIALIYGEFESILTNRNKHDPTAYNAIKNA